MHSPSFLFSPLFYPSFFAHHVSCTNRNSNVSQYPPPRCAITIRVYCPSTPCLSREPLDHQIAELIIKNTPEDSFHDFSLVLLPPLQTFPPPLLSHRRDPSPSLECGLMHRFFEKLDFSWFCLSLPNSVATSQTLHEIGNLTRMIASFEIFSPPFSTFPQLSPPSDQSSLQTANDTSSLVVFPSPQVPSNRELRKPGQ